MGTPRPKLDAGFSDVWETKEEGREQGCSRYYEQQVGTEDGVRVAWGDPRPPFVPSDVAYCGGICGDSMKGYSRFGLRIDR